MNVRGARTIGASWRLAAAAIVGVIAAVLTGLVWRWAYAPALGWGVAGIVFSARIWLVIWPMDAPDTPPKARAQGPERGHSDGPTPSAPRARSPSGGHGPGWAHSA